MTIKEFELNTEKEQFFNCAFVAALANGKSIIHSVKPTPEISAFAEILKELGAEVSITKTVDEAAAEEDWEITGTNFNFKNQPNLNWLASSPTPGTLLPYQIRNKKILEHLLNGTPLYFEEKIAVRDSLIRELITFGANIEWQQDGPDENDELARRIARAQKIKSERKWIFNFQPTRSLLAKERYIAGDVSQAAMLALRATLIRNSEIKIKNVNLDSSRSGIFSAFKRMGADIEIASRHERGNDIWGDISVKTTNDLVGRKFNPEVLAICLDEIPLIAVMACFAKGETILHLPNYSINIYKPVLEVLFENLKTAGVDCGLFEEGLILRGRDEINSKNLDGKNHPILESALQILREK